MVEIEAVKFSKELGFQSSDGNVVTALKNQFNFINKKFRPITSAINGNGFYFSAKYIGTIFGSFNSKATKELKIPTNNNHKSVKRAISKALKEASLAEDSSKVVSFFVFVNHGNNVTAKTAKIKHMHVCVYTVRDMHDIKDCIYHDPSPECCRHFIPECVSRLPYPIMRSSTRTFGAPTQFEDCMYQWFKIYYRDVNW